MIGVLLVSHGKMAAGIEDSVSMIIGETSQFATLSLVPGQDVSELQTNILNKAKELDSGKGVLVFVDIYGASPHNASMRCLPELERLGVNLRIITGMSLPMVMIAVCNRDSSTLDELAKESVETGIESIRDAIAELKSSTPASTESDDY